MNLDEQKYLSYSNIDLGATKHGKSRARNLSPFNGQMQQLIINGKSYFELIDNGDLFDAVNRTVKFQRNDMPHKYPITLLTTSSWLEFPKIQVFHMLLIQFHFKTTQENGLILYNNGQNSDYLAVELVDGQISYKFSLGKAINVIKSRAKEKLNDNKWHLVTIWRSTKTDHELTVDSLVYRHSSNKNENMMFNLVDRLYVGGLRDVNEYKSLVAKTKIESKHGFKGCIASLEINGRVPDFAEVLNGKNKSSGNIHRGCESSNHCQSASPCMNHGVCEHKWEENEVICNCEYTTFVGKHCEKSKRINL